MNIQKIHLLAVAPLLAISALLFWSAGGDGRALAAPPGSVATWEVSGWFSEACSCDPICPCWLDKGKPTLGYCNSVAVYKIEEGHYGQVRLDDLVVVMALASPEGETFKSGAAKFKLLAYYVDESTTQAQRQAIEEIWRNHIWSGFKASSGGLKAVRVTADIKPDYAKVSIPNVLTWEVKEWKVRRVKLPSHVHSFPDLHGDLRQGSSVNYRYADYGLTWGYPGKDAVFSTFKASSPKWAVP